MVPAFPKDRPCGVELADTRARLKPSSATMSLHVDAAPGGAPSLDRNPEGGPRGVTRRSGSDRRRRSADRLGCDVLGGRGGRDRGMRRRQEQHAGGGGPPAGPALSRHSDAEVDGFAVLSALGDSPAAAVMFVTASDGTRCARSTRKQSATAQAVRRRAPRARAGTGTQRTAGELCHRASTL